MAVAGSQMALVAQVLNGMDRIPLAAGGILPVADGGGSCGCHSHGQIAASAHHTKLRPPFFIPYSRGAHAQAMTVARSDRFLA